jgi:PAS domain S-box-containing protein
MKKALRILVVEDSEDDALLVLHQIKSCGYDVDYERVQTSEAMKVALREKKWDIVLSDYMMPHFNGLEALTYLKESGFDIPFIIISGTIGEDIAVEAMKAGAHDYLMKNNLQRLLPAIERELREAENRAERKRAELQLVESERKFRSLAESSPDNIIRYDTECRAVYINRNFNLTVGSDVVSYIGHTPMESNNYPGTAEYQAKLQQVIQTGNPGEIEVVVPDLKGEFRFHHIRFVAERNNDSEIIGALAIGRDITERKHSEMEIAHANRTLRMLSETNQALIHITDESTLLSEICRIAVEVGGYRMAWVGYAEHDEAKTVTPLAHAGFESGYIESLNLTWADTERGRGPSGIAIRTGQAYVVHNIESEASFSIWKEAAVLHGYKSFIALPLICESQTLGVMAIYSVEKDAFCGKEVEILKELADDLAFGITTLHNRAKRKIAEKALKESEERFRLIAENTADTIAVLDLSLAYLYISPSVKKLRGFSAEEAIDQSLDEVFTPASLQKVNETFTEHMALEADGNADPNRSETLELEEYCKDGSTIWVEISVSILRDANLNPTGLLTVSRDITERKQVEEKLRILSRAVEQSPASIIITDTKGNIEYVNTKFTEVTGYTWGEVVGQNPRILKSGEMSPDYYKEMWQNLTSGKEWYGEFLNKKKNGELFWELASISPIFDTTCTVTHLLAVKEDITNRKQIENELKNAKEKAEENDRLKTKFLHNMSHEIRTPMNGIIGYSELLCDSDISAEKQKQYTQIITNSSNQLLRIIDDILEISQLETKQVKACDRTVCLNDLLFGLFSIFDMSAKEKKIPLYLKKGLPDDRSIIFTDEKKLSKIVSNLLENALKFTQTGYVEIGYKLEDSTIIIYVEDSGMGINPEMQELIFERFSQEEIGGSKLYGGLGLGLSIAKENIKLLGGTITLKSEKGKGSTFYISIPYKPALLVEKNCDSKTTTEVNDEIKNKYTVLVVEDEEVNYLYLEALLERYNRGIMILHSRNGLEAVEICKKNKQINLVLMDIKMPVMNGYEATKLIKEFRPDLPIVAQTAYSTTEDKEKAKSAGCDDFISKPIGRETLNFVVAKYLSEK